MIELRTATEIEQMRPAGRFVAEVLDALVEEADVGVNLLDLDQLAHRMIKDRGAESCYIDYHPSFGASPFGKVLCTSVNDAVLHGLPHDYVLKDGDLLSLDFAVAVDGWVSDSAISVAVGTPREQDLSLIDTTTRCLEAGIGAAQAGHRIGDISAAIAGVARADGYSINTQFGGHGVGRTMHGDPHVPNDGRPGGGSRSSRAWSSRSSRGCSSPPTRSTPTPTAGRCAVQTAHGARTWSTPSRSPRTARSS